jgi:hypothetical protein
MDQCNHKPGSQDVHHKSAEKGAENPHLAGFPSFEGLEYNLQLASSDINIAPTPLFQTNDEGSSTSPASMASLLTFLKVQVPFHDAFDIDAYEALPSIGVATDFIFFPAPLAPEGPLAALQGEYIFVDPPIIS